MISETEFVHIDEKDFEENDKASASTLGGSDHGKRNKISEIFKERMVTYKNKHMTKMTLED